MSDEPRRVLMTVDAVGGVWRYAMELLRGLPDHEFTLIVFGRRMSPSQREEAQASGAARVVESELRLEWMDDPWEDLGRARKLLSDLEGEVDPHLIHLNGYALAAEEWSAPVLVAAHSCVLSWWRAVKHEEPPACWREYQRRVRAGLERAAGVLAPTAAMLDALWENYEVVIDGVVVPNGVDPAAFRVGVKRPRILTAGRLWDEAKNLALLERIAPGVRWPIYAAGAASHRPNGVELLGELTSTALREEMSRATIYASPAWYEPFGLAVLEAALSGCALVLADIPSFREVWGDAAVFVDPAKPERWQNALNELSADFERCEVLGARARQHARRYSSAAMALGHREIYERLARVPALVP